MPYTIQGNPVSLPTEPFEKDNKNYVSLREVVEALKGTVAYDNTSKIATAAIGPWTARVEIGSRFVQVNGNGQSVDVELTAPTYEEGGTLFVPFDFFRDAYGYNVAFDNGTIHITNPNA